MVNKLNPCKYYPCHDDMDSCEFCYCPLYKYRDCFGPYVTLNNGLKNCSHCNWVHKKVNKSRILLEITKYNINK